MKRTRMKKLALLVSLLALGALGLVACEGGDDDEAAAASETETARDEPGSYRGAHPGLGGKVLTADHKSCGSIGRYRFAVVYGDISCHVVRGVVRD